MAAEAKPRPKHEPSGAAGLPSLPSTPTTAKTVVATAILTAGATVVGPARSATAAKLQVAAVGPDTLATVVELQALPPAGLAALLRLGRRVRASEVAPPEGLLGPALGPSAKALARHAPVGGPIATETDAAGGGPLEAQEVAVVALAAVAAAEGLPQAIHAGAAP